MHKPKYVQTIQEVARLLDIECRLLTGNWTIQLRKKGKTFYIIGGVFPLNDAACYKIVRNKNVCSEILQFNGISCVPHQVLFSPSILRKRSVSEGNRIRLEKLVNDYGFPLVLKKNNTSRGEGVYRVNNEAELEDTLAELYTTEEAICLSPFRAELSEYRCVILDGECLLTYEKHRPVLTGNGISTVMDLFYQFVTANAGTSTKPGFYYDTELAEKSGYVPNAGEFFRLQWKHNRALGSRYVVCEVCNEIATLAIEAAKAVGARFVTVDVVHSPGYGLEVMEVNASVGLHPFMKLPNDTYYDDELSIYLRAIEKLFT